ncbi:tyrosine-type recombinase/integrase [Frankia nepalensis]|uniref:tyrosine-type recombinase/integrase n=1 Tax=Frankia nepalensis TaxID=1836974 RepID=UPI0027DC3E6F|nr:site-specific integrase [Frankia nepalensis]
MTDQDAAASTGADQTSSGRARRNRRAHGEGSVYWREDRKRWVVEIDYGIVNGRRKKVPRYFKTQEEAIEAQREARQAHADGIANLDRRARFGDFLTYWLDEVVTPSERAASTKSNYQDMVKNHVRPGLGKIRVVDLKHEDVQRFLNAKAAAGYSTSTMRTLRTVISQALDEAVITEKASRNVAKTVRVPKARTPRRQVAALNRDDGLRLLAAAKPTRFYAVYVLLAMVGLRRGEVLALRWRDFDQAAGTLRVELQVTRVRGVQGLIVGPTKSRAGQRTIALPGKCIEVLNAHRRHLAAERQAAGKRWKENGLIFPNTVGRHQEPRALNTHLTELSKSAGLRHLGPHALRHTAATMAYALGVDWKQIQAMLGHTMLSTTMDIYVDMVEDVSRDAAAKLDAWFDTADDGDSDGQDDDPDAPDISAEEG